METYAAVGRFCYLGDMLGVQGGADAAVTMSQVCRAEVQGVISILNFQVTPLNMKGKVYTACLGSCFTVWV